MDVPKPAKFPILKTYQNRLNYLLVPHGQQIDPGPIKNSLIISYHKQWNGLKPSPAEIRAIRQTIYHHLSDYPQDFPKVGHDEREAVVNDAPETVTYLQVLSRVHGTHVRLYKRELNERVMIKDIRPDNSNEHTKMISLSMIPSNYTFNCPYHFDGVITIPDLNTALGRKLPPRKAKSEAEENLLQFPVEEIRGSKTITEDLVVNPSPTTYEIFLVKFKGHKFPEWVHEKDTRCHVTIVKFKAKRSAHHGRTIIKKEIITIMDDENPLTTYSNAARELCERRIQLAVDIRAEPIIVTCRMQELTTAKARCDAAYNRYLRSLPPPITPDQVDSGPNDHPTDRNQPNGHPSNLTQPVVKIENCPQDVDMDRWKNLMTSIADCNPQLVKKAKHCRMVAKFQCGQEAIAQQVATQLHGTFFYGKRLNTHFININPPTTSNPEQNSSEKVEAWMGINRQGKDFSRKRSIDEQSNRSSSTSGSGKRKRGISRNQVDRKEEQKNKLLGISQKNNAQFGIYRWN